MIDPIPISYRDQAWLSLPHRGHGELRMKGEDFVTIQTCPYQPRGQGQHLWIHLRKSCMHHRDMMKALADGLGIVQGDIGFAAAEDHLGISFQWLSLPLHIEPNLHRFDHPGLRITSRTRHTNKLREGHHHSTHYQVRIKHWQGDEQKITEELEAALAESTGLFNLFDRLTFGAYDEAIPLGLAWIKNPAMSLPAPFNTQSGQEQLARTLQRYWFNAYLVRRMQAYYPEVPQPGEVLVTPRGGAFVCHNPDIDRLRIARGDISLAGPLFGRSTLRALGDLAQLERDILHASGITPEQVCTHPAFDGGFRPLTVRPSSIELTRVGADLLASFCMPKDSSPKCILSEILEVP